MKAAFVILLATAVAPAFVQGHPFHDSVDDGATPEFFRVAFTTPSNRVTITERGDKRIVESNGIPNHQPGQFPNRGNPNSIREQNYHFEMLANPAAAARPAPVEHMIFGVSVNGVVFDPGTAEFWRGERGSPWRYEAIPPDGRRLLGLDEHNAHVQPDGAYHYHALPLGLVEKVKGPTKLLGWAADGFPIYGPQVPKDPQYLASPLAELKSSYRIKNGTRPAGNAGPGGSYDGTFTADYEYAAGSGDLDECNGRFGITPEFPKGTYYYVITSQFPYLGRLFRGIPDMSFMHRGGPPPGGPGRGGFPPGPPDGRRPPPPL